MFTAWEAVIYAQTEAGFEQAWKRFDSEFGEEQGHTVAYITATYMPYRHQWAQCFIKHYRNFGQRVNSPNETAHKALKSILITGRGHLLTLHNAIVEMNSRKQRIYEEKATEQDLRLVNTYRNQEWLDDGLPTDLTRAAMALVWDQGKVARAARKNGHSLLPCTKSFTQQMGLPCSHTIFDKLEHAGVVTKLDCHPRWWLFKPLTYENAFERIRDPEVVVTLRGRPRVPKNSHIAVPIQLQATPQRTRDGVKRTMAHTSRSRGGHLSASVRRHLSQDELAANSL